MRSLRNFSMYVAYSRGSVLFRLGDEIPKEEAIFGGCPGHSKALAMFDAAVGAEFAAKGIIQSPITSCSRRRDHHSVCHSSANRNPENSQRRRCGLSAGKGVMGVHTAQRGRSVISTIALFAP